MVEKATPKQEKVSVRKYLKFFIFYGLFNMAISIMWGAYNNYFPIILQSGNPNFAAPAHLTTYGFGLSAFVTGLIMSIDNFMGTAFGPIFGALGDRSLRRKELGGLFGIICGAAFALIPTIANMITAETTGRTELLLIPMVLIILAAFATIFTDSMGGAYRSGYQYGIVPRSHHSKLSSFQVTFGGVGFIAATLVSSALYTINKAYPFYVGSLIMVMVSIAFYIMVPSENEKNERIKAEIALDNSKKFINPLKTIKNAYLLLERDSKISMGWMFLTKTFASFGIYGLQTFASSYLLIQAGIAPNLAAIATAVFFLGYVLFSIPMGFLGDRFNKLTLYTLAILVIIAGGAGYLLVGGNYIGILIVSFAIGMANSVVDVLTIPFFMSFVPKGSDANGTMFSACLSIMICSTVFIVPLLGFLIDVTGTYSTLFYTMIITASLALIPLSQLKKIEKRHKA
jgi:MFS family permease